MASSLLHIVLGLRGIREWDRACSLDQGSMRLLSTQHWHASLE